MLIVAPAFALLATASLAGLAFGRFRAAHGAVHAASGVASLVLLAAGLHHLWGGGGPVGAVLPVGLPFLPLHLRLDALSALFLVIVNLSAAVASLFALSYGTRDPHRRRATPAFPLFLLGMNAVLLTADAYGLLVAWEFMSLSSWALVVSDHANESSRRAGLVYLTMAAFGTLSLLACFGVMETAGGLTFAALRAHPPVGGAAALAVALAILGAGSKAGLVPLHAWLPLAHPAAPAPASALMSGVMTKVAFYVLIRILFDLMGGIAWPWGLILMGIGAVTAVLGVLYALLQDDLKRLLAYSTVENIGVIAIALGLAILFRADGRGALAALALVAALYHMLNHSVAKSLMFLGSGTVIQATGRHRLDRMGGLLNRLPWTGAAMLVGAASMAALPPFNGFVSEWLIFQSLFAAPASSHWAVRFGVPVAAAALALAAALAAACFVRAFGIAFLGRPRSVEAATAVEAPWPMRIAVAVLAALCIGLGAVPVTVTRALAHALRPVTGAGFQVSAGIGWPFLSPVGVGGGAYSGTVLVLTGLVLFLLVILLLHRVGSRATRVDAAWDCGFATEGQSRGAATEGQSRGAATETGDHGFAAEAAYAQYSAAGFTQPLRRTLMATLFGARETVTMPAPGDMAPATHRLELSDPVWRVLYGPLIRAVEWLADGVNRLHFLSVRRYLLMMFVTLVILLLAVAIRQT
jgi:formate hydrogenlyase subunit 3/multisubunit Na+/H+ antiporter MnhD subunit